MTTETTPHTTPTDTTDHRADGGAHLQGRATCPCMRECCTNREGCICIYCCGPAERNDHA